VAISPLSWAIEQPLSCKSIKLDNQAFLRKVKARKIYPRSAQFSLRFFKSDRLLEAMINAGFQAISMNGVSDKRLIAVLEIFWFFLGNIGSHCSHITWASSPVYYSIAYSIAPPIPRR